MKTEAQRAARKRWKKRHKAKNAIPSKELLHVQDVIQELEREKEWKKRDSSRET